MVLAAPLATRRRVIQVKVEAQKGTAETTAMIDVLAFDLTINPTAPFEERKGTGKVLGHTSPGILGEKTGTCTFTTELRGTDSSALDLGLVALLQSCGILQTTQVYTPESDHATQKTLTIWVFEDGVRKILHGCMGTFTMTAEFGKRVMLNFEFQGIWNAPTDQTLPTVAHSAIIPARMDAAAGVFTLATEAIKISTFEFNVGNAIIPRHDVGALGGVAYFMIGDRDPTFGCDAEADKIAGYDIHAAWLAGTEVVIALTSTNGTDTFALAIPKFQYRELPEGDRDGIHTYELTGQCNINAINVGDDEWSLTVT